MLKILSKLSSLETASSNQPSKDDIQTFFMLWAVIAKGCKECYLYNNNQKANLFTTVLIHGKDKSFEQRYKADKNKSASRSSPSELSLLYPSKKPHNTKMGGCVGVFERDLNMHCGIAIDPDLSNACLTRRDGGVFI